jgi:hypothetical protein
MINKSFLEDYSEREIEKEQQMERAFESGQISGLKYPSPHRFPKLSKPVSSIETENIWSLLPMYGSCFQKLPAMQEKVFGEFLGLDTKRDIDRLIELSKEGLIFFTLPTDPRNYETLDFLEPILRELRPPWLKNLPFTAFGDEASIRYYKAEFETMSVVKFYDWIKNNFAAENLANPDHSGWGQFITFGGVFVYLELLGYHDICQIIIDRMLNDPQDAMILLSHFSILVEPRCDPVNVFYQAAQNWDQDRFKIGYDLFLKQDTKLQYPVQPNSFVLPHEVGKLIFKVRAPMVEDYYGCLRLKEDYKTEELQKLIQAYQEACEKNDIDLLHSTSEDIQVAFSRVWENSKRITQGAKLLDVDLTLAFGLVGYMATHQPGVGLLASLGYSLADKYFAPLLSERLAKLLSPSYLVTIHKFRKNNNI